MVSDFSQTKIFPRHGQCANEATSLHLVGLHTTRLYFIPWGIELMQNVHADVWLRVTLNDLRLSRNVLPSVALMPTATSTHGRYFGMELGNDSRGVDGGEGAFGIFVYVGLLVPLVDNPVALRRLIVMCNQVCVRELLILYCTPIMVC